MSLFVPLGHSESPIKYSLEYKLAVINGGKGYLPSNHPTVQEFRRLLISLERRCKNTGEEIADMTVTAQRLLKKNGINMSLLEVMTALNKFTRLIQKEDPNMVDFAKISATYVTLRTVR